MKKFTAYITERAAQIEMLQAKLEQTPDLNVRDVQDWVIAQGGNEIGRGQYGRAFVGDVGGWLIKLSKNDKGYWRFAESVLSERTWEACHLFPKIKFHHEFENSEWACTAVEKVKLIPQQEWRERMGRFAHVGPQFYLADYFRNPDIGPVREHAEAFMEAFNIKKEYLRFFFEYLTHIGTTRFDTHEGNMGLRANGELVIFDPVT